MRIGLTYDLRKDYLARGYSLEETAEFDSPATVEGIAAALERLGHEAHRIGGARALAATLANGERWDLVFNIAEGLRGLGRESLVPCLLDEYDVPYTFSDPMVLALSLHKGACKRVIRDLGVPTAPFAVVEDPRAATAAGLEFPLFAKPVAEGTGKGISDQSIVHDARALRRICLDLLARHRQPVLVEEYLPGEEFTVGIVGTGAQARAIGALQVHILRDGMPVYSYENKAQYEQNVAYTLVTDVKLDHEVRKVAVAAWRGLGCRDGGRVDLRTDRHGQVCFVEVNPLAGLNPVDSDLPILCGLIDWSYDDLIEAIVASAAERIPRADHRPA